MQCLWWGSNLQPLDLESSTLLLSHCATPDQLWLWLPVWTSVWLPCKPLSFSSFCGRSLAVTSTEPCGFMFFFCFIPEHQQWFWFKTFQQTDWWSRGSISGPLGTRQVTYPLHHNPFYFHGLSISTTFDTIGMELCILYLKGLPLKISWKS